MSDNPQEMQRIGMIRLIGQNLPIESFRLLQPPGLVVLDRDLKGLFEGELSHNHVAFDFPRPALSGLGSPVPSRCPNRRLPVGGTAASSDTTGCPRAPAASASRGRTATSPRPAAPVRRPGAP